MGCSWSEAADTALGTIATTFMSEFMEMDSLDIGMALLAVLIAGMPGTTIGNYICKRYDNPVFSAKVCLVLYIVVTLTASLFLRPGKKNLVYIFGFLWGICQGWMHPQHTVIFVTTIPKGKGEVELMGLFLFAASILSSLPSLVFSVLNEASYPMWVGLATLIFYFVLGLIGHISMGDYNAARSHAQRNTTPSNLSEVKTNSKCRWLLIEILYYYCLLRIVYCCCCFIRPFVVVCPFVYLLSSLHRREVAD
jgi:MFS-type transporter involved in bile tolerance (Atg22 family)